MELKTSIIVPIPSVKGVPSSFLSPGGDEESSFASPSIKRKSFVRIC